MTTLSREDARRWLVACHGLDHPLGTRHAGIRAVLAHRRCIQLDPLDVVGTNADLVALARVDGIARGDVYDALLPGHAFEHFAKERCLLPASAWPAWRDQARETPWWRTTERLRRLDRGLVDAVEEEVRARGPVTASELEDRGRVEPLDWSGWKGTARAVTMALEVLWVQCRVVVCGRTPRGKRYDIPERALPDVAEADAPDDFATWALLERAEACGLLSRSGGPWWGQLGHVRTTLPDRLVAEGLLEQVTIEGSRRPYLAPAGFRERPTPEPDDRMRLLGPLDPLLWDRKLVQQVFGFDYVWEVYKPAEKRRWGWYVCPLLHRGRLVGRIEARASDGVLTVANVWEEEGSSLDHDALHALLRRHASALGVDPPKAVS